MVPNLAYKACLIPKVAKSFTVFAVKSDNMYCFNTGNQTNYIATNKEVYKNSVGETNLIFIRWGGARLRAWWRLGGTLWHWLFCLGGSKTHDF